MSLESEKAQKEKVTSVEEPENFPIDDDEMSVDQDAIEEGQIPLPFYCHGDLLFKGNSKVPAGVFFGKQAYFASS